MWVCNCVCHTLRVFENKVLGACKNLRERKEQEA